MGLFANYNKEGPGVYEDDLKHGPFVSFFQIYGSKFFKLCTTNLIFLPKTFALKTDFMCLM